MKSAIRELAETKDGMVAKQAALDAVDRASGIDRESNDECEAQDMANCLKSSDRRKHKSIKA